MIDFGHLPRRAKILQTFGPDVGKAVFEHVFPIPRTGSFVYALVISPGGAGGGGATGIAGTNRGGGGGGSPGNVAQYLFPTALTQGDLVIRMAGPRTGAAAGAAGGSGTGFETQTYICGGRRIGPGSGMVDAGMQWGGGGAGTSGSAGSGGFAFTSSAANSSGGVIVFSLSTPNTMGALSAAAGGAVTGADGRATSISGGFLVAGGCGGAGVGSSNVGFTGGAMGTGSSPDTHLNSVAGGASGGGAGVDALRLFQPEGFLPMFSPCSGGGSNGTGAGGKGGSGGIGCGGSGGGGGTTGGAGGNGGIGYILVVAF